MFMETLVSTGRSEKVVSLGERQNLRGFAGEEFAVGFYFISFGVDGDFWGGIVPFHIFFAEIGAADDSFEAFR